VGSALSVTDILSVVFSSIRLVDESYEHPRDIVILSKGHAASALYSALSIKGFFDREWLNTYCEDGSKLGGHVTSGAVPGVELSTGSLGHGLPYGVGIALARKKQGRSGRVFVIMSDGECNEGTTWESALIANHHQLSNLCVIIDRNRLQSLEGTETTLRLEPFSEKWKAFGWETVSCDGHNHEDLEIAIRESTGPKVVIGETTKGKGVSFMENSVDWHYRSPSRIELEKALGEVGEVSR
jgi:transketolase